MVAICGVCATNEAKYKCPVCELRYCSIPCYKSHKSVHKSEQGTTQANHVLKPPVVDRPGTKQRVPKVDFTGFENDQDFLRLLSRFPTLKHQLQLVYGITIEPGFEEGNSWSRRDWFPTERDSARGGSRDRGRARGRGRGRGRGGRYIPEIAPENRLRGAWTHEKGDKQGVDIIQRMRQSEDGELAEGMDEFIQLCQIKFGQAR